MDPKDFKKTSPNFLGKVRSNFMGTCFHIYDNGKNPKKCKTQEEIRKQLAVVLYEQNVMGDKGPRKMRVLVPEMNTDDKLYEWKPTKAKEGMHEKYQVGNMDGIKYLFNKPPK